MSGIGAFASGTQQWLPVTGGVLGCLLIVSRRYILDFLIHVVSNRPFRKVDFASRSVKSIVRNSWTSTLQMD